MRLGPRTEATHGRQADDAQLLALVEAKVDRASITRKLKRSQNAINARSSLLNKRREGELGPKAKK
jgi:hypothetical protein